MIEYCIEFAWYDWLSWSCDNYQYPSDIMRYGAKVMKQIKKWCHFVSSWATGILFTSKLGKTYGRDFESMAEIFCDSYMNLEFLLCPNAGPICNVALLQTSQILILQYKQVAKLQSFKVANCIAKKLSCCNVAKLQCCIVAML